MTAPLPIDPLLPRVCEAIRGGRNLVLVADPGAGKTTRVPRALLEAGLLEGGACWVLEPRRLAARLAAARVAEELGEALGQRVGYAVRFESRVSRATRIRFVTEGLLLRRLQEDPRLRDVGVVVLDELHERHLHTDLALALLRRLQRTERPDLRLVAMSATLDPGPVAAFLEAEVLRSEGRAHPVDLQHLARPDDRPLATQVAEAVEALRAKDPGGHALVFLPGAAEIRACEKALLPLSERQGVVLLPLHGSLSFEAQKAAVAPSAAPKVLLSTNVAESSVTLDGVSMVVDSGLAREAVHSPWTGLTELRTRRISQARCTQRAGRAGRQGPGRCLRLFTEADHRARPGFDPPELQRADLAELLLSLRGLGLGPADLAWLEPPPEAALAAGEALLRDLGALGAEGGLTSVGRRMAALPLHPRLARLVVAGEDLGIPRLARLAAVLLETGDLARRSDLGRRAPSPAHGLDSDLWVRLDAYLEAEAGGFGAGALRAAGLDGAAVRQARLAFEALLDRRAAAPEPPDAEARVLQALLRAYPDRVARRGGQGTYALVGGGGARLAPESRVRDAELILALEAEPQGGDVLVRMAARLEPEWLLEAFPEAIEDREVLAFHGGSGRVERRAGLYWRGLCLDETRRPADPEDPRTAQLLAEAALGQPSPEGLESLLDRLAFLARMRPDLGLPDRPELSRELVASACAGCASLKDLQGTDWTWVLRAGRPEAGRLLDALAPEAVSLPKRRVKVNYGGEAPWIESRLQDFLGMREGPRVAGGAVPLVLHLLAPNFRAVQVTTDLAGFWQRAYRELRPQLSRRYPRHLWPEDPLAAEPPARKT